MSNAFQSIGALGGTWQMGPRSTHSIGILTPKPKPQTRPVTVAAPALKPLTINEAGEITHRPVMVLPAPVSQQQQQTVVADGFDFNDLPIIPIAIGILAIILLIGKK